MIRRVTGQDAQAIADIYNEYVLRSVATFELKPVSCAEMSRRIDEFSSCYPYFVYEENRRVLGYCYAHRWRVREAYRRTWETTVYIDSSSRGKGIGKLLVSHLIEECRRAGIHVLVASVVGENNNSRKLHESLGFRPVSHFREVGRKFGRWLDIVEFQLILQDGGQNDTVDEKEDLPCPEKQVEIKL